MLPAPIARTGFHEQQEYGKVRVGRRVPVAALARVAAQQQRRGRRSERLQRKQARIAAIVGHAPHRTARRLTGCEWYTLRCALNALPRRICHARKMPAEFL
jgi:hypothetical protein